MTLAGKPEQNQTKRAPLNAEDQRVIIPRVMEILETGQSSKFQFEGAVRHGLRAGFCLDGLPWAKADSRAAIIIEKALHRLGASRPTWMEAQPEYAQDGFAPTLYSVCQRCGSPLAADVREGTKYCSRSCKDSAQSAFRWRLRRIEGEAGMRAVMAARKETRKKTIGNYLCETCGTEFERLWKPEGYRFCSHACSGKRKYALEPRPCAHCGAEFYPTRGNSKFCSPCLKPAKKAYNKAYHASPPPSERPCAVCGRPFCPAKKSALYCSAACNNRAYRARQRRAPTCEAL